MSKKTTPKNEFLKIIFSVSVLLVFVSSTLFVALSSQYIFIDRQITPPTQNQPIELQRQSAPKNQSNSGRRTESIIKKNSTRFQDISKELGSLNTLYQALQTNETPTETINSLIASACAKQVKNPENIQKCQEILAITLENLKTQYYSTEENKLMPQEFLIDLMNDLVTAGLISEELLQDLNTIKIDLQALGAAIKSYLANPNDTTQAQVTDSAKKLLQDIGSLVKSYGDIEKAIDMLCSQTKMPEGCDTLLTDASLVAQEYQAGTWEEGDLINLLKADLQTLGLQKFAQLNEKFFALNTAVLNTLRSESAILFNLLTENIGSLALNSDIADLTENLNQVKNTYQELYTLLNAIAKKQMPPSQALIKEAFKNYAKSIANLAKNYFKYAAHSDITAHYIKNITNLKSLKNQVLYSNDLDDIVSLSEKYKQLQGDSVHNLINDPEKGLLNQIELAKPPITQISDDWFALFNITNSQELMAAYTPLRYDQNAVDKQLNNIHKTEIEIAKQTCKMVKAEDVSFCTYAYGSILQAISEGESMKDAVCAQSPDPEKCKKTWDSFVVAISDTRNSENPSFKVLIDNLAKQLLSEAEYQKLASLIAEATSDQTLSKDEIKTLFGEIASILYNHGHFDQQIDNIMQSLCKKSINVEECISQIKELINLARQVYQGDISEQEGMTQLLQEIIADLTSGDSETMATTFENIDKTITTTLMANEFVTALLINRQQQEYSDHLVNDYQYIAGKQQKLQEISAAIIEITVKLQDENLTDIERAQLSSELTVLTIQLTTLLWELQSYYISNYYPNMYAASYLVINLNFTKQLKHTTITNEHLSDIISFTQTTHPEQDWTKVNEDYAKLVNITAEDSGIVRTAITSDIEILDSNDAARQMTENKAKETQKAVNNGMKQLLELKQKLSQDLVEIAKGTSE